MPNHLAYMYVEIGAVPSIRSSHEDFISKQYPETI